MQSLLLVHMPRKMHRRGEKKNMIQPGLGSSETPLEDRNEKHATTTRCNPTSKRRLVGGCVSCFIIVLLLTLYAVASLQSGTTVLRPPQVETVVGISQASHQVQEKSMTGTPTQAASSNQENDTTSTSTTSFMAHYSSFARAIASHEYDHCAAAVSFVPPVRAPDQAFLTTKPLWLTAFPGSGTTSPTGHGDIFKPIINAMTGLSYGAKFYHASSKSLKRCKGMGETVTCANAHPVVDIKPQSQAANFDTKMILVVRHFQTAFATHDSEKGQAYHQKTGQNDIASWRKARDTYYAKAFEEWKGVVQTWKAMPEYEIGMYAPYEHLFHPVKGPALVATMADLFQQAGFAVAPKQDLSCLWYQAVKPEYERLQEYWRQYNPGYTEQQRDDLLDRFRAFREEAAAEEDMELAAILEEYINSIKVNMATDVAAADG